MDRPPTNADEELEQFRELGRTHRVEIRDTIIENHLGLAHHLAHRFANRGEPYDDLYQVACMALVKAVERFDPERAVKFSSFAVPYIVGELKRHFRDKGWSVRAPRRVQELYLEIGPQVEALTHDLGRNPTVAEIAESLNEPIGAVLEAIEASRMYRADSLDTPTDDAFDTTPVEDTDATLDQLDSRAVLTEALRRLSPRTQYDSDAIRRRDVAIGDCQEHRREPDAGQPLPCTKLATIALAILNIGARWLDWPSCTALISRVLYLCCSAARYMRGVDPVRRIRPGSPSEPSYLQNSCFHRWTPGTTHP